MSKKKFTTHAKRKSVSPGFDSKLLVKIVIIIALLFAVNFTWKFMKKVRADRERENLEAIAQGKKDREDALAQAAEERAGRLAKRAAEREVETPVTKIVPEAEAPGQSLARLESALASGARSEMPVGSVRKGDSDYFLVSEPMAWAQAAWFAEQHGGHLAMPGSDLSWLPEGVTKGKTSWLGAARSGADAWTLVDGTPWTPASPPAGSGAYLAVGQNGAFTAADGATSLPFVIQWRSDGSNPGTLAAALAATRASLAGDGSAFPPGPWPPAAGITSISRALSHGCRQGRLRKVPEAI